MGEQQGRLEQRAPNELSWLQAVRSALQSAPLPKQARTLASNIIDGAPESILLDLDEQPKESVAAVFRALCGNAPFFAPFLVRHPEWLVTLSSDDYQAMQSAEVLGQQLDTRLAAMPEPRTTAEADAAVRLRHFKYLELARITVRDCSPSWLPLARSGETLTALSLLADLLLDRSLRLAQAEITARFGPPRWMTEEGVEVELGFCVLGLGKLGSEELNYSSDVDLIYIFETPPHSSGELRPGDGRELGPTDYFTRLAQRFGTLVGEVSADGFLYRIDLDLRPDGAQGNLVVSSDGLGSYYESWADTWEKATFMKARPVAGDTQLGWRTIRSLDPMIYRSTRDYAAVESIKDLKTKIAKEHGERGSGFNVKIDSGGIRDIEFIAQSTQLLHGGRIPQVRARSTQDALERLAGVGALPPQDVANLLESYRFLRRLENRLQMQAERQTHLLSKEPAFVERIARSMGHGGPDASAPFEAALKRHRERVIALFEAFLTEAGSDEIFELFCQNAPNLVRIESSRRIIRELSESFAREIGASHDAQRALNNLDRFIEGVGQRPFYYSLLSDRPELVVRLAALFANSRFLSGVLTSHPKLIEPVFRDPAVLIPTREAMRQDLEALIESSAPEGEPNEEARLDALRLFKHRQVLNAGLLDLAEKIDRATVELALTDIAEVCVEAALEIAREALAQRPGGVPASAQSGDFLIVGMGKLASHELGYGSDLDLIFLFDTEGADPEDVFEAQEYFVRLAQRFISTLQSSSAEGACYEIDARLRPSGNQGLLVSSLASFARYHEQTAEAWERQALLRARPIVGGEALARTFEALRLDVLQRPAPSDLAEEIHRVRLRMEEELAQESSVHHNFKTGRGGLLDVENAVQYLQLRGGAPHPELLDAIPLDEMLSRLADRGAIDRERCAVLREGWAFLQQLGSRLRIVENRSISDLDEEHGDLEGLALRLGYASPARVGGARRAFLQDYHRHTDAIRATYLSILGLA